MLRTANTFLLRTANAALPPNKNGRAFLFGWAAQRHFRICGIFFAPRREIPLDAVRQSAGSPPFGRTNFAPTHRKISPQLLLPALSAAFNK